MTLSVVILSYNVRDLLRDAINAVYKTYKSNLQVIVVDNASTDGSVKMIKNEFPQVDLVVSKINTGFSAGNNLARKVAKGDVVLFLNPDTKVQADAIKKCLGILTKNKSLAAITCRVMLPNGNIDYSCHRGLPTVWNTFCYWTSLANIFSKSQFFAGYTATYLDPFNSHYIDCVSGTFLMVKRSVLEEIGWWDEDYWWNGDDIEFCYKVKKAGYKIWYEASVTMLHFKGASSGLWETHNMKVSKETKIRSAKSAARAMSIFVSKHSKELGPLPIMILVNLGINLLEKFRIWKIERGFRYV